jgi:hypothetical protein
MKWAQWLKTYKERYKRNFTVQKFGEFPFPWIVYESKEYDDFIKKETYVNHREVFYDELVFDIDMNKDLSTPVAKAEAKKIAFEIKEKLNAHKITHTIWETGGSGCHIHAFFPELFNYNTLDNIILKRCLLLYFAEGYIRPRNKMGKVQLQKNTLIQLEDAKHRKGGKKKMVELNFFDGDNVIPKIIFDIYKDEKEKNHLMERYFKADLGNKPEAILFLENEKFQSFQDGRDRALYVLIAYYKQFFSDEDVFKKMVEWNRSMVGNYFSERIIKAKIRSAKPCLPVNYLIELLIELGADEKYTVGLRK